MDGTSAGQRREHFRLEVCFLLLPQNDPTEEPSGDCGGVSRLFRLLNLSGGGCLCLDPEEYLEVGTCLPCDLHLGAGEGNVAVRSAVLRREVTAEGPAAALRFLDLRERDRERIVRALFCEYRRGGSGEYPD